MSRKSKQDRTQEQEQQATQEQEQQAAAEAQTAEAKPEEGPKARKPKPLPSEEAEVARLNGKYAGARVLRVAEWGKRGATRVVIGCSHVNEDGTTCGAAREIAVQDAFQVRRCIEHQKRAGRKGRSAKRAAAMAELRAENERLKAMLAGIAADEVEGTDEPAAEV